VVSPPLPITRPQAAATASSDCDRVDLRKPQTVVPPPVPFGAWDWRQCWRLARTGRCGRRGQARRADGLAGSRQDGQRRCGGLCQGSGKHPTRSVSTCWTGVEAARAVEDVPVQARGGTATGCTPEGMPASSAEQPEWVDEWFAGAGEPGRSVGEAAKPEQPARGRVQSGVEGLRDWLADVAGGGVAALRARKPCGGRESSRG